MLEIPRRKLLGMTMAVFGFFTTQSGLAPIRSCLNNTTALPSRPPTSKDRMSEIRDQMSANCPASDLRLPTTGLRPPTSDHRPPPSDPRLPTSDLRPPTPDLRPSRFLHHQLFLVEPQGQGYFSNGGDAGPGLGTFEFNHGALRNT